MNQLNLKWRARTAIGSLDVAVASIAISRNTLVVLIPFAIATLVTLGAVWWA